MKIPAPRNTNLSHYNQTYESKARRPFPSAALLTELRIIVTYAYGPHPSAWPFRNVHAQGRLPWLFSRSPSLGIGKHYTLSWNRIVRSRHSISSIVPPMMFSCAFFFTSFIDELALLKKARWIRLDRSLVVREIEKLTNTSTQLAGERTHPKHSTLQPKVRS
uniref:Uncharacterized protein n=1 Tax=Phlegmariurus squarrosus TaxID=73615 RepID=H9M835_PHLSQ|nr:hypothetical protein HusqMp27 [Phlegmariurus squarrosus]AEV55742.1 hypothetical protein HusqMp27 [Phlegmariurus squarrosus]